MKPIILKLSTVILLFAFISAGCQKDELIDEHYPFKLHYTIKNEDGQEVTRLKEGEDFYIYFSIENISDRHSPIDDHHLFGNDELFKVFEYDTSQKEYLYKGGIEGKICTQVKGCLGQANTKFEFNLPWSATVDSTVNVMCCTYELKKQPSLPVGKYLIKYTGSIPYYYKIESGEIEGDETRNYNLKHEFEIIK